MSGTYIKSFYYARSLLYARPPSGYDYETSAKNRRHEDKPATLSEREVKKRMRALGKFRATAAAKSNLPPVEVRGARHGFVPIN